MQNFFNLYKQYFNVLPQNVLEIGSRDGNHAEELRLLANLPPQQIFVVEPHPESAKRIRTTYPDFKTYECAIYNKPAILNFNAIPYIAGDDDVVGCSSLLARNEQFISYLYNNPEHWTKVIGITGTMLLELINQTYIYLAKIDVEGATYEVLESFGDNIMLFKMLHLELEKVSLWDTPHSADDIRKLLTYYGFEEVFCQDAWAVQQDSVWRNLS